METWEAAKASLGTLAAGVVFMVLADESYGGRRTYYKVDPNPTSTASLTIDFVPEQTDLASQTTTLTADFTADAYTANQTPSSVYGVFTAGYPLTRVGVDAFNLVTTAPTSSASSGIRGDISISGNNYDFHNGTQWVRLTGVTF